MSFSEDPYRVLRVVTRKDGTLGWNCDSCGGGWRAGFPATATVQEIREHFNRHVAESHRLTPDQTKDWSPGE